MSILPDYKKVQGKPYEELHKEFRIKNRDSDVDRALEGKEAEHRKEDKIVRLDHIRP